MSVAQTVQTFTGILNENEFYGHHYLAEVFQGDIRAQIEKWQKAEEETSTVSEDRRAPHKRLGGLSGKWFAALANHSRLREDGERLQNHLDIHAPLLEALGYKVEPQRIELQAGMPIPVWASLGAPHQPPQLVIVPGYQPGLEEEDPLENSLTSAHYGGLEIPKAFKSLPWLEIVTEALFGADQAPRYVILVGLKQWLLLDRYKWPNNRLLRFDWTEILDRKETYTLQASAALLHHDSLAPDQGGSLLDGLDENAHKHAFGVSEDLKYALREAIELLGNEAVRQLRQKAQDSKIGFYTGKDAVDAGELSLECLRLVYRLLFMFYIEARPELGYVPIRKSEIYAKGYSLESLRDLELTPLNTQTARDGTYFDQTLRRLFSLVADGCGATSQQALSAGNVKEAFTLAPLDSKLFDHAATPLLNQVKFPNHVWQQVIRLMSLSGGKSGKGKGRVSYQLLSINQLGAVYEALLSYRGFFAKEDLYEVQPEPKKNSRRSESDEGDESDDDQDSDTEDLSEGGVSTDMLDSAWFVPASRIGDYKPSERVHDIDENGHKVLRKYPRDTFIYRLAGRDRQKSASYYTPQVLTRCLVKYALKELLKDKTADDILTLTVVEPAMGSAAFLNEAVNQLSEAYLERKQAETKRRIPHEQYATELQKVRMYIADRNVFGVDMNPIATELAEVSLWLNAIYGEPVEDGLPPRPARVPWFGYQLFSGNSLIGARREVYKESLLLRRSETRWHEIAPRRLNPQAAGPKLDREADEIYHFLLPDPGMCAYKDKVGRSLYPQDFERLKAWRKTFNQPLEHHEIKRLQQLSDAIDSLWAEHTTQLAQDRARTEDPLSVWPGAEVTGGRTSRAEKEAIRKKGLMNDDGDLATPYRRLKLVMDYWCALWFWPIIESASLPTREEWWLEVGAILEGNIIDVTSQPQIDFTSPPVPEPFVPESQPSFIDKSQLRLATISTEENLHDRYGQLRISKLRENFSRIKKVEATASQRRFMHWELNFADVFARRGGFDLVLGNPPWLRVQWNEAGILGEANPMVAIRKLNATELAQQRSAAFVRFPSLQSDWTTELEEAEATQNYLNAQQNFPLLKGMKANLYKCFIPSGWMLAGGHGVVGFLHPESPYDDPDGGLLREAIYPRLRAHFQFQNELKLFEIGNRNKFGINIFGSIRSSPAFDLVSNLFTPTTIDACYQHDGHGLAGGIKNDDGEWNTAGHADRIVRITDEELNVFANLYDEAGTPSRRARLPVLHAGRLSSVLTKLSGNARRLANLANDYFQTPSTCWNEKNAQDNGTIVRNADRSAPFPAVPEDWVMSAPHFALANPLYQTPKAICSTHRAYEGLDLEILPDDYLPRTNYRPMADRTEYHRRVPRVSWSEAVWETLPWDQLTHEEQTEHINSKGQQIAVQRWHQKRVTEYFRAINRERLSQSGERTLITTLVPPGLTWVNTIVGHSFKSAPELVGFLAYSQSLPIDFHVKSTGVGHANTSLISQLPIPESLTANFASRVLSLNCLTFHYAGLWAIIFTPTFTDQRWSQPNNPRLPHDFFSKLTPEWQRHCALRADYARRMALLEVDVLVAQALGLALEELVLMHRVMFPVMQQYERDTWYDMAGRIVFTNSKGLAGVGLPRRVGPRDPQVKIEYPDGTQTIGGYGWEDISKMQEQGNLPAGTIISHIVRNDTLPSGPFHQERRYTSPFVLADREEDYRIAWEFFELSKST